MKRLLRLFAILIAAAVLLVSRDSRADTSAAIYDDLKDVIAKLVERRVANGAADFVERASPAMRFYLRRTIDRVRHDQWSAIREAIIEDLGDLVSDYAYWAMLQDEGKRSFRAFVGCFEPAELHPGAPVAPEGPCGELRHRAEKQQITLYADTCETKDPAKRNGEEIACGVAAMVRAAFLGHEEEASSRAADLMTTIASFLSPSFERGRVFESNLPETKRTGHHFALARLLERFASGSVSIPAWLKGQRSTHGLQELLDECTGGEDPQHPAFPREMVERAKSAPRSGAKLALLCLNAWVPLTPDSFTVEVGDVLRRDPSGKAETFNPLKDSPAVIDAALINEFFRKTYASFAGATPGKEVTIRWGRMRWRSIDGTNWIPSTGAPKPADLVDALKVLTTTENAEDAQAILKELADLISAQSATGPFACGDNCPFEVLRLGAEITDLREHLRSSHAGEKLEADVDAALRLLRSHADDIEEARAYYARQGRTHSAKVLGVIKAIATIERKTGALSGVPALVRSIVDGDRSEFATAALKVAFSDVIDGYSEQAAPTEVDRLYGAFVVNFFNYVLGDKNGRSLETARDGFRVSAARLLDSLSSSDGYFRRGFALYPVASLRFSWNPAYFSATSGDGFRYVASVDWPAVRTRFGSHVAVQFSMFDFAAPLAELALRKPVAYSDQEFILLDTIRPRLSLFFGIPQVTRNVVLTVGVSARLLALCRVTATSDCDPPKDPGEGPALVYRSTLSTVSANSQIPEVNLGVSYVF